MMRTVIHAGAAVVALATLTAAVEPAFAQSCQSLWVERNSIYKARGYCFKTARAIRYFGNAGCRYEYEGDIPLSGYERRRIAEIRALERDLGCD